MKTPIHFFFPSLFALLLLCCLAAAQGEAGGGRIPNTNKSKPEPAKSPNSKVPVRTGSLDRIDGKWWTTGNDFGPSELILTQSGATISGQINFADGRTGTLRGTLVGKRLNHTFTTSNGGGGSGWLELSWANFLGGSWRNQSVKDGSWTLNRIEGQWCFNGNRTRIRRVSHDANGRLTIVTEDGTQEQGHLDGPFLFLDANGQSIKGDMFYKGNRLDFASGFFWTWCGR